MATRIILLGILGFLAAGAILWYVPATHGLIAGTVSLVQSNGLIVLLAAGVILLGMTHLFARSATNARRRKRELDEILRVAQQLAPEKPQSFKRMVVDAPPTDGLNTDVVESQTIPESENISSDVAAIEAPAPRVPKVSKRSPPRKRKAKHPDIASISDDIYFRPVTNVLLDKIIGYDISRQAVQKAKREPLFVQHLPGLDVSDQASFEFHMLENAAIASQQDTWSETARSNQISFFVRISGALLDDKVLWRRAAAILRKQSKANPSITLNVLSSALADESAKIIKERLNKIKRLHDSNVPLALCGFDHDRSLVTDDLLDCFYVSFSHKDELLGCYSGEETPNRCLTYQQIINASLQMSVEGIVSEADVVDCLSAGAQSMSGDYLAPPRKLRSEAPANSQAGAQSD